MTKEKRKKGNKTKKKTWLALTKEENTRTNIVQVYIKLEKSRCVFGPQLFFIIR